MTSPIPWIPTPNLVVDGTNVSAEVVNPILQQLVQNLNYLYNQFGVATDLSVLTAFSLPIHPDAISANSIQPGYYIVGAYITNSDGVGISPAVIALNTTPTNNTFAANNSSYPFGITTNVQASGITDLATNGLLDLTINIDDPVYGLLDYISPGVTETFQIGPYYLSQKTPGKITSKPSGLVVFVGFAISKTQFLLNPSVNQLSQLFINFRFNILTRPTATPVITGSTWTIPNSDMTRLGWVDIAWLQANNPSVLLGYTIPANAAFYYNIPAVFTTDNADNAFTDGVANGTTTFTSASASFQSYHTSCYLTIGSTSYLIISVSNTTTVILNLPITSATGIHFSISSVNSTQQAEATALAQALPPTPAQFSDLFLNGVRQDYYTINNVNGSYLINNYGLWWLSNVAGTQPWSNSLALDWTPADWLETSGDLYAFLEFLKFNPNYRQYIVSSLAPYNAADNNTANVLTFVDKSTLQPSSTGDLLAKLNLQFDSDISSSSSATAIVGLSYDQVSGALQRTIAPIVSALIPGPGLAITPLAGNPGQFTITNSSTGLTGQVFDLEPIGTDLDNFQESLHTYLRFPAAVSSRTFGVTGKIILPAGFPNGNLMYIVLHLIGFTNVSSTNTNVGLNFSYNCSTVINGNAPSSVLAANTGGSNTINPTDSSPTLVTVSLPSNYVANQAYKFKSTTLAIPATNIGEDTIVNFKIVRTTLGSNAYPGDVGLLAVYYSL